MTSVSQRIATELSVREAQVAQAVQLLDDGATVPFIARYRKEQTGGLDDTQLRTLEARLGYLRDLDKRRQAVLKNIDEQGKLTEKLKAAFSRVETKTELEDLYLPFKRKRSTKAQTARDNGLEPLAELLLKTPSTDPETAAAKFVNGDKVSDAAEALEGARTLLIETFSEDAGVLGQLRAYMKKKAMMVSRMVKGKEQKGQKFSDYFDYAERFSAVPSHRALALFRGRKESVLHLKLEVDADAQSPLPCEQMIARRFQVEDQNRAADSWLIETVRSAWKTKLLVKIELDLLSELREQADAEAIRVFGTNLKHLLLAAPAGASCTLGLDPGIRTGVKVAVVDGTGKLLDHTTIFPHEPRKQWDQSIDTLAKLCKKHTVGLVSIGNGTASRETEQLTSDLIKRHSELTLKKVMVSEAGASVYSASETAAKEFPDLDVSIRGAVSIARRLQDPLAELVKIEPKSIGVGQYQHDVNQARLSEALVAVVEDCVNAVGVDVNMASAPLLHRVSGLNKTLATNIVAFRDEHGAFVNREQLKKVPRLGAKAFEQCAGFMRISNGDNPLDASAVHPEAYAVVEQILATNQRDIQNVIGEREFLRGLEPANYSNEQFGELTIRDIFAELEKPGRDPRPEFKTASFKEGVDSIADLKVDMTLEGVVTNVTNFGAFVDVGVHQDGLVHVSELANKFVKNPHEVVKAGDIVKVRVKEVDAKRKRIALTMKLAAAPEQRAPRAARKPKKPNRERAPKLQSGTAPPSAMALALAKAKAVAATKK